MPVLPPVSLVNFVADTNYPGNIIVVYSLEDAAHFKSSVSLGMIAETSDGDIFNIALALEGITNAKVCSVEKKVVYDITGNKANPVDAPYRDKFDLDRQTWLNTEGCRETIKVAIPAPVSGLFTGIERVIGVDPAVYAPLQAFITAYQADLCDSGGQTSYSFEKHYHDTVNRPAPSLG
jgi:hypothetical protein